MKPDCHLVESSSALRKTILHLSSSLLTSMVVVKQQLLLVLEMSESSVMQVRVDSKLEQEDLEILQTSDSPSELPMLVVLYLVSLVEQNLQHLHQKLVVEYSDSLVQQQKDIPNLTLETVHSVWDSVLQVLLEMVLVVLPHSILLTLVLERQISTELLRHQEQETLLVLVPSSHLLVLQNPAPRSKRRPHSSNSLVLLKHQEQETSLVLVLCLPLSARQRLLLLQSSQLDYSKSLAMQYSEQPILTLVLVSSLHSLVLRKYSLLPHQFLVYSELVVLLQRQLFLLQKSVLVLSLHSSARQKPSLQQKNHQVLCSRQVVLHLLDSLSPNLVVVHSISDARNLVLMLLRNHVTSLVLRDRHSPPQLKVVCSELLVRSNSSSPTSILVVVNLLLLVKQEHKPDQFTLVSENSPLLVVQKLQEPENSLDLVQHSDLLVVSPLRQADHQLLEHYSDSRVLVSRRTPKHTTVLQKSRQQEKHSSTSVLVILVLVTSLLREVVQKQESELTKVLVLYLVFLEPQSPDFSIQSTRQLCSDLLVQVLNVLLVSKLVLVDSSHSSARRKSELHHQNRMDSSRFLVLLEKEVPTNTMVLVLSSSTPKTPLQMSMARHSSSVQKRELLPFHQLLERYSRSMVLQKQIQSETTLVVEHSSDLVEEQKELHSYRRQLHSSTLLEQQEKRELQHMLVLVLSLHSSARRNLLLSTVQQVEYSASLVLQMYLVLQHLMLVLDHSSHLSARQRLSHSLHHQTISSSSEVLRKFQRQTHSMVLVLYLHLSALQRQELYHTRPSKDSSDLLVSPKNLSSEQDISEKVQLGQTVHLQIVT